MIDLIISTLKHNTVLRWNLVKWEWTAQPMCYGGLGVGSLCHTATLPCLRNGCGDFLKKDMRYGGKSLLVFMVLILLSGRLERLIRKRAADLGLI